MKRTVLTSVLSALMLMLTLTVVSADVLDEKELEQKSQTLATSLLSGNYDAVSPMFSATLTESMPKEKFVAFGTGLRDALGQLKSFATEKSEAVDADTKVSYLCTFEQGKARMTVTYTADGKISAMAFKPIAE